MRRVAAKVLRVVIAVMSLLGALWLLIPATAIAVPSAESVQALGHDGDRPCAYLIEAGTERGPPTVGVKISAYDAEGQRPLGVLALPDGPATSTAFDYNHSDLLAQAGRGCRVAQRQGGSTLAQSVVVVSFDVAANGGERLLWTSWQNYPKVTQGGREYAQIGDRLYSHHAVDRLQPSGLGAPAGATGAGRSISPNFVETFSAAPRASPSRVRTAKPGCRSPVAPCR